jgi:endonuclease/exonuclease/phosphatase family metal-dependent hydrolase
VDQAHLIAERLQAGVQFHAVSEIDEGRFGNAVLSTLPMRHVASRALPAVPSAWNLWSRGALWVTVQVEGREIHILNTHLSILDRERRVQARALTGESWLGNLDGGSPVVLAGDLNAAPGSPSVKLLQRRLRDAVPPEWEGPKLRTWSGRIPVRRIDHVLVSDAVSVNNVYVPRTRLSRAASDHLPLVVDLVCRVPAEAALV